MRPVLYYAVSLPTEQMSSRTHVPSQPKHMRHLPTLLQGSSCCRKALMAALIQLFTVPSWRRLSFLAKGLWAWAWAWAEHWLL